MLFPILVREIQIIEGKYKMFWDFQFQVRKPH